jgi:hypothetical protein
MGEQCHARVSFSQWEIVRLRDRISGSVGGLGDHALYLSRCRLVDPRRTLTDGLFGLRPGGSHLATWVPETKEADQRCASGLQEAFVGIGAQTFGPISVDLAALVPAVSFSMRLRAMSTLPLARRTTRIVGLLERTWDHRGDTER